MPRIWKYTLAFLAAAVLLVFLATFSLTDTRLHLVFCDVGQGDAILVYRGSTQILIDGGPDSSVLSCLSNHMPFWDRKLELVVLTHPDSDHYAGLVDVVRRYQIGAFAGSGVGKESAGVRTLGEEIEKKGIKGIVVNGGQRMAVGDVELGVVWPTSEWIAANLNPQGVTLRNGEGESSRVLGVSRSGSANEYSVVLHLKYGEFDALLTGDIVPPATDIVAQLISPHLMWNRTNTSDVNVIEVLKVPHHGSKNGLTQKLLEAMKPKLAVISVGKNNRYGHPHKDILNLLNSYTVKRTDLDGEIEIVTDGIKWWYNQ